MLVLMKKIIMGEKGMRNGEFHHFWVIFATCTGTGAEQVQCIPPKPNLYRYRCGIGAVQPPEPNLYRSDQSCTGTGSALFFYFDQRSYFGHNLFISDPI